MEFFHELQREAVYQSNMDKRLLNSEHLHNLCWIKKTNSIMKIKSRGKSEVKKQILIKAEQTK